MRAAGLALLIALAGCGSAPPAPEAIAPSVDPPVTLHRQQFVIPVSVKHPRLVIDNPHGDIRVRPASARSFEIFSVAQRLGEEPEIEGLEVEETPTGVHVRVAYPSDARLGLDHRPAGHRKGRVDLVVFAPPGTRAELNGHDDLVSARRLDGQVRARSRDGDIKVSVRGSAELASRNGSVSLTLMNDAWVPPASIETHGGDITLQMPAATQPRLTLATDDKVTVPMALRARHRHEEGRNHLWRDGNENSVLNVVSDHGMIVVRLLPDSAP